MSELRVNNIKDQAGTGQPDIDGLANAWVNFNGTGTVAINDSFNVSSITDNGVGAYQVNFANALSNANYAVSVVGSNSAAAPCISYLNTAAGSLTTTDVDVSTTLHTAAAADTDTTCVIIFAN